MSEAGKTRTSRDTVSVAKLFLKLGCTAFGGPAAHISMMEQEVVGRRGWLSREEFLDLLGAANLIPGPSSTEMAIFIGYRRAGWRGLVLGGVCFILPAALMVSAIAWAYVNYHQLPQAAAVLYGIKPVIIAIVAQALWKLGRTAVKTKWLAAAGVAATVATALGANPILVLLCTGALTAMMRGSKGAAGAAPRMLGVAAPAAAAAAPLVPVSLWKLALFFLKVGAVLFGSGYVLLAFLRGDLVQRWHWLSENQLLDAVAVGQFTPGPLFTTATFIGYVLGGPWAAAVATVAIFLPSFLFVGIGGPLIPKLRRSAYAGAFLDGVNVAALALMAVVTWQLAGAALVDWVAMALALAALVVLLRFPVNSAWLVGAGAVAGLVRELVVQSA